MIDRQTLELGILFGNSKLWNEIGEEEVFAVALSQEKIGYCTIVGRAGIHIGCIMYIGEEDFTAIENNIKLSMIDLNHMTADQTFMMHYQNSLQCYFEEAEYLPEEYEEEIAGIYEEEGLPYGKNTSVPYLCWWGRRRVPVPASQEQQADIKMMLSATVFLKDHTEDFRMKKEALLKDGKLPFLKMEDNGWTIKSTPIPNRTADLDFHPQLPGAEVIDFIRRKKTAYRPELHVTVRVSDMVVTEPYAPEDPAPYYPLMLMIMKDGFIVKCILSEGLIQEHYDKLLAEFAEMLADWKKKPGTFVVDGMIGYNALKPFCEAVGIELKYKSPIPDIEDACRGLYRFGKMR